MSMISFLHVYLTDLAAYPTGQLNMTTIRQSAVYYSHVKVHGRFLSQTIVQAVGEEGECERGYRLEKKVVCGKCGQQRTNFASLPLLSVFAPRLHEGGNELFHTSDSTTKLFHHPKM